MIGKYRNNLHMLTPEQRAALAKYARDMQTAKPQLRHLADTSMQVYQSMLDAQTWHIADAPLPPDTKEPPEQKVWTIGAPKVNYVDHIDHIEGHDAP